MSEDRLESPYYPPRARWYSRMLSPWFRLQRLLHLEKIHLPAGYTFQQFVLSLLIPGYALMAGGRRVLGWTFVGVYGVSGLVFIAALGYQLGSLAFGLLISIHASSIIFLETCWLRDSINLGLRLVLALMILLLVWLGIYSPLVSFAEEHLVMPLRVHGNVVIVQRLTPPARIQPGDWIMYSFLSQRVGDAHREGGAVMLRTGFSWGPVLAVAGQRVEFATNGFSVNGITRPLLPHMPEKGELVVPEKHWFVWPELAISGQGNVSEANLSALMLQLATVSEVTYVGKPFQHWFGRRQKLL